MYAGVLGNNAVERYALFLTSLALTADPAECRTALQCACEHGLDVPRVVIVMAERTIEGTLNTLPRPSRGPYQTWERSQLSMPRCYLSGEHDSTPASIPSGILSGLFRRAVIAP
jgi:hypothetical protein